MNNKINVKQLTNSILINFIEKNFNNKEYNNYYNDCGEKENVKDKNININKLEKLNFSDEKQITFFPTNLDEWFNIEDKYFHKGCLTHFEPLNVNYNINISLFSSIFTCLFDNFSNHLPNKQSVIIQDFILLLKKDSKKKFSEFEYKNKDTSFTSYDLIAELDNGVFGGNIFRYISDYLHINIFVLDVTEDNLTYGNIKIFIPYKKTIFLLKFGDNYEPMYTKKKYFSIEDEIIKIIENNIEDIDVELVVENENLNIYNVKPLSISYRDRRALGDLLKKQYFEKRAKLIKEEQENTIKLQDELRKKK